MGARGPMAAVESRKQVPGECDAFGVFGTTLRPLERKMPIFSRESGAETPNASRLCEPAWLRAADARAPPQPMPHLTPTKPTRPPPPPLLDREEKQTPLTAAALAQKEKGTPPQLTAQQAALALDVKVILTPPLYISLVILDKKCTGWRRNEFNVHA
jgi:hypothetical protein